MNRVTTILLAARTPEQFRCLRPLYERLELRRDFDVRVTREPADDVEVPASGPEEREETARLFGVPLYRVIASGPNDWFFCDYLVTAGGGRLANVEATTRVRLFETVTLPDAGLGLAGEEADFFLAAGAFMQRQLVESGWLGTEEEAGRRVEPVGFPPADRLAGTELSRRRELERWDLDGTRPVILFVPTRLGEEAQADLALESLCSVAGTGRYDLLVNLAPSSGEAGRRFARRVAALECPRIHVAHEPDRTPLLFLANLLVTDGSSVSNEFVLTDRPILFLDAAPASDPAPGAAVHLEWWARRAGQVIQRPEEIVGAIDEGLRFPEFHSTIRRGMARDLLHRPGSAADAIVTWLEDRIRRHSWEAAEGRRPGAAASPA